MSEMEAPNLTEKFLAETHANNAIAPIRYADRCGAFVESNGDWFYNDAFPIVSDANTLRGEIGRVCRNGHRTVLLTGANAGTFRIYCAEHVLDEVSEHIPRWASEMKIPTDKYRNCWQQHFLPHIRLVNTSGLFDLLSPEERTRMESLRQIDPDDVPSATLALTLGAPYVTEDAAARFAVYDVEADFDKRRAWLEPLICGGNAGELHKLAIMGTAVPTLTIAGVWNLGKWLYEKSPWALAIVAGIGIFGSSTIKCETYVAIGTALGQAAFRFSDGVIGPYNENIKRFCAMAPSTPSYEELLQTNNRDSILARACVQTLARSRKNPMTVRTLADELPTIGIGQNVQRIGKMLHKNEFFVEPYRGRWQVGHAIIRVSS